MIFWLKKNNLNRVIITYLVQFVYFSTIYSFTSMPKCLPVELFTCTSMLLPFFTSVTGISLPLPPTNRIVSAFCTIILPISLSTEALIIRMGLVSTFDLPTVTLLALPFVSIAKTSSPASTSDRYLVLPSGVGV